MFPKRTKYKNTKIETSDGVFDSKAELKRWESLKSLSQKGEIQELKRQVPFVIVPSVRLNGRKKPDARYYADFTYIKEGVLIVEDVKSPITRKTPYFRLKKHLMKYVHGIEITEV